MEMSSQGRRHVALILATYCICFGSYALVDVPFWDDWVILQNGQQGLWEMFQQLGRREQFPLVAPFALSETPMLWGLASFICWGVVSVSIYGILRQLNWADTNAMWAALLTAAVPLNEARFALAMLPYSFSAAFFSTGLYLVATSVKSGRTWPRVVAALLLFWSFPTNSFLTISWLAPLVVFLVTLKTDPREGVLGGLKALFRRFELLLLPLVYWTLKTVFQPPYGLYEGYNQFQMSPLKAVLLSALRLPSQSPDIAAFFPTVNYLLEAVFFSGIAVAAIFFAAKVFWIDLGPHKQKQSVSWLAVLVLFWAAVLALFPYTIVGISPSFMALWETRHQTTLSLVAGALIFSFLLAALPVRLVQAISMIVLFVFMACDISASRQLLTDVRTTKALLHSQQVASIPSGTMLGLFETDNPHRFFSRSFQFYDASSVVNANRVAKDLIMLSQHEVTDPQTGIVASAGSDAFPAAVESICRSIVSRPQYGFGDFASNGWYADVTLTRNSEPASFPLAVSKALWGLVNPEAENAEAVADLNIVISPRPYTLPTCPDRCCSTEASKIDWKEVLDGLTTP